MNSSAVEGQEARAQSVAVTEEALSVDFVDGRIIVVALIWYPRLCMVRLRSAVILSSSETAPISIGRIWTKI
jgi:hypothetical protein